MFWPVDCSWSSCIPTKSLIPISTRVESRSGCCKKTKISTYLAMKEGGILKASDEGLANAYSHSCLVQYDILIIDFSED